MESTEKVLRPGGNLCTGMCQQDHFFHGFNHLPQGDISSKEQDPTTGLALMRESNELLLFL